jgi:hypothetical protein
MGSIRGLRHLPICLFGTLTLCQCSFNNIVWCMLFVHLCKYNAAVKKKMFDSSETNRRILKLFIGWQLSQHINQTFIMIRLRKEKNMRLWRQLLSFGLYSLVQNSHINAHSLRSGLPPTRRIILMAPVPQHGKGYPSVKKLETDDFWMFFFIDVFGKLQRRQFNV